MNHDTRPSDKILALVPVFLAEKRPARCGNDMVDDCIKL
jgi:hypothetical protein